MGLNTCIFLRLAYSLMFFSQHDDGFFFSWKQIFFFFYGTLSTIFFVQHLLLLKNKQEKMYKTKNFIFKMSDEKKLICKIACPDHADILYYSTTLTHIWRIKATEYENLMQARHTTHTKLIIIQKKWIYHLV